MSFLGRTHLCQRLDVPRVTTLLVTGRIDSFFLGVCHVSHFGWLCRFRWLSLLPINIRIPPLPFTFLKFPPLTSLVLAPSLEVSPLVLSSPPSRAKYFPHPHS